MVNILIIGAAGMVGGKLADRLINDGTVAGEPIEALTLADIVAPPEREATGIDVACQAVDLAEPGVADRLIGDRPEVIFHVAAITSGEAEADFDKGFCSKRFAASVIPIARGWYGPRRSRYSAPRFPTRSATTSSIPR